LISKRKIYCKVNGQDSLQFAGSEQGFMFEARDHRCHSTTIFPTRKALKEMRASITEYLRATRRKGSTS
jgi:hypothetical protein